MGNRATHCISLVSADRQSPIVRVVPGGTDT